MDLDLLIGGPDRPPSKKMMDQARSDEIQARQQARAGGPAAQGSQEGYWDYMQRQMAERTEKLNLMGDSVNKLGEASSGWADAAGKFVQQQKKNMIMGGKFLRLTSYCTTMKLTHLQL
jgi:syntaxin-binding protein 5